MIWCRHSLLKRIVTTLFVVMSFVLANQSYITLVDRMEHASQHEHLPNPLAGNVHYHDHCMSSLHACDADEEGNQDALAHHHGEAAHHVFLTAEFVRLPLVAVAELLSDFGPYALTGLGPGGPDHPPKPHLEIRV